MASTLDRELKVRDVLAGFSSVDVFVSPRLSQCISVKVECGGRV